MSIRRAAPRRSRDLNGRVTNQGGTEFVEARQFIESLTSRQLKIKPKANNISGLQVADLFAHPSLKAARARLAGDPLAPNFGGEIAQILLDAKYDRSESGTIDGWGIKWLPQKRKAP